MHLYMTCAARAGRPRGCTFVCRRCLATKGTEEMSEMNQNIKIELV